MKLKVLVRPEPVGAVELWLEVAENLLQTIVTACAEFGHSSGSGTTAARPMNRGVSPHPMG